MLRIQGLKTPGDVCAFLSGSQEGREIRAAQRRRPAQGGLRLHRADPRTLRQRHTIQKKTGKTSTEIAYGLTDHSPESASPQRALGFDRGQWGIEAHHYHPWFRPTDLPPA